MRKRFLLAVALLAVAACGPAPAPTAPPGGQAGLTPLPPPDRAGEMPLETALSRRRSVREFNARPLTDSELGQLLWAAQGLTDRSGYRTAPSAGALYPLELYVATADGLFHYDVEQHTLAVLGQADLRPELYQAALRQEAVRQAPALFVIAGVYERTAAKYGAERSPRYVHLEAGHAAQNLLLQAVALGLGAVPIGAFDDAGIRQALGLPVEHRPLYLIPVGEP